MPNKRRVCISRPSPDRGSLSTTPTGTRTKSSQNRMTYLSQATGGIKMYDARGSASDMARRVDVPVPGDSGAKPGSSTTCPEDVTAHGEWYENRNNGNSTLPSDIGDNAGWVTPI
ncbi:hypothetical protein BDQ94DRAFT_112479 [Aspergillus welwitschiae]|uniref:Uncharacterized protein n=1 Tax=Aspergillus welwitschiae TaxID=1341132 RepID=A0A3F3PL98_9EURO|nr:hypothetical protein BDQ94DRAFT_112479 [Aspergillus welwitschiae]RDH27552.1 hypothetical protein BDQ94DRAFT_112479 [Aspergillus welwitschiae]